MGGSTDAVMVLLTLFLILAAFASGYAVAVARLRRGTPEAPEVVRPLHELDAPAPESTRIRFERDAERDSPEWRQAMADIGQRLRGAGVRLVVFAHGSFVGDDPLAMARALEDVPLVAPLLADVARGLRGFTRAQVARFLGDLSNYTRDYVDAFARATGVDAIEFAWSGENHHAARVQGAVRLARAIALHRGGAVRAGDGVLLAGHSHGGQLFALLSQLVARASGHEDLLLAAHARGEDVGALEEHAALLRRCSVDVVTFGTPPRYGWARGASFRVLHVVNHRGAEARGGTLRGLFHTRRGDYVHQLGVPGSDFPAPTAVDRALNARLDRVLGVGTDVRALVRHLARGMRVAPHGHTILVDYRDAGGMLPNFLASGLGHAAYTRDHAMLFHARVVTDHFYPSRAEALPERLGRWLGARRHLLLARRVPSSPEV
jgi:hypothetical protein